MTIFKLEEFFNRRSRTRGFRFEPHYINSGLFVTEAGARIYLAGTFVGFANKQDLNEMARDITREEEEKTWNGGKN